MIKASIISQKYFHNGDTTVCLIHAQIKSYSYLSSTIKVFRGKSKRNSDDTYDQAIGDILAESRAFEKLYKYCNHLAEEWKSELLKSYDEFCIDSIKYRNLLQDEKDQQEWDNLVESAKRRKEYRKGK